MDMDAQAFGKVAKDVEDNVVGDELRTLPIPEFATPFLLRELSASNNQQTVRVVGALECYDPLKSRAVIKDSSSNGCHLNIDTSGVEPLHFAVSRGKLVEMFGELTWKSRTDNVLITKIIRDVDGLDIELYGKNLQMQRQFLKELEEINKPVQQ